MAVSADPVGNLASEVVTLVTETPILLSEALANGDNPCSWLEIENRDAANDVYWGGPECDAATGVGQKIVAGQKAVLPVSAPSVVTIDSDGGGDIAVTIGG